MRREQKPVTDPKHFLHVSSLPYHLPGPGKDITVDRLVAAGELKLVGEMVNEKGDVVRFAVSKGKTYRRSAPKPKRVGAARRQTATIERLNNLPRI